MTNEEINILINMHIDELEHEKMPSETQRERLIKALKQVTKEMEAQNGGKR